MKVLLFALVFGLIGGLFGFITEKPWVDEQERFVRSMGYSGDAPELPGGRRLGQGVQEAATEEKTKTIALYFLGGAGIGAIVGAVLQTKKKTETK